MKTPVPLHALLIGIDRYAPAPLYDDLFGCVRDVDRVEKFLRRRWDVPAERIEKLVAPRGYEREAVDASPTHANLVAAFRRLRRRAAPGEQVWIHYVGHGGRAATVYPEVKGPRGCDEALVPVDIGDPRAPYLRDLEIAALLAELVDHGLAVTLVLDACHSGGAVRHRGREPAGTARARGARVVDRTPRPASAGVAAREDLLRLWQWTRGRSPAASAACPRGSRWLPEPRGYVLLAACQEHEVALEDLYDGQRPGGALTHFLLAVLERTEDPTRLTYRDLFAQVQAELSAAVPGQNPQLEGDADRFVLGDDRLFRGADGRPARGFVPVLAIDRAAGRLQIGAGAAQAVRPGARFAVFPPGTHTFDEGRGRQGVVELDEIDATSSWGRLLAGAGAAEIVLGAPAIPIRRGAQGGARGVRLDLPRPQAELLLPVLEAAGRGFVVAVPPGKSLPRIDFRVRLEEGGYAITDGAGRRLPELAPIPLAQPAGPRQLVQRLVHLTIFEDVLDLVARSAEHVDRGFEPPLELTLTLEALPDGFDPAVPMRPVPLAVSPDEGVAAGSWVALRIHNASERALQVAAFALSYSDYSIASLYPRGGAESRPVDGGADVLVPLELVLDDGRDCDLTMIEVIAAAQPLRTRWLTLPPIDRGFDRHAGDLGRDWIARALRLQTVRTPH